MGTVLSLGVCQNFFNFLLPAKINHSGCMYPTDFNEYEGFDSYIAPAPPHIPDDEYRVRVHHDT